MADRRYHEWEGDSQVYSEAQIEAVASYCGIAVERETGTHLIGYCPFHHNSDSAAFALDKELGVWTCFNPACGESGTLPQLLGRLKGLNRFEATRIILKNQHAAGTTTAQRVEAALENPPEFIEFPAEPVERMTQEFWQHQKPQDYMMLERGFEKATLEYFEVGYSQKRDMVIVPMHDPSGMLVGFIGRAIDDKIFKNSNHLPKSRTPWNMHRAKRHGETVVIVESSYDAMRVHQAGYPNVIAVLGGSFSVYHAALVNRHFSEVIYMTDFDKRQPPKPNCRACAWRKPIQGVKCVGHRPGRDLARQVIEMLPNKRHRWAAFDDTCVYPHEAKDAGNMTDDEIALCLRNSVSDFTYSQWGIEDQDLALAS